MINECEHTEYWINAEIPKEKLDLVRDSDILMGLGELVSVTEYNSIDFDSTDADYHAVLDELERILGVQ
jgi:hypothetical protein